MRDIEDILNFRTDISPFLVHLTKQCGGRSSNDVLKKILQEMHLLSGDLPVSDARFGVNTTTLDPEEKKRRFSAICLTETPLGEIHCLLDIAYRGVQLSPYGLVFLKDRLAQRGVSPVLYLNNEDGRTQGVFHDLVDLLITNAQTAAEILPLIAVFGKKITPPGASQQNGHIDFRWEREWRYPYARGPLKFTDSDVFVGLCPADEIPEFEDLFPGVGFVDPTKSTRWYSTKLIEARQRLDIKFSVV